jgi:putative ABC transport system permease protein
MSLAHDVRCSARALRRSPGFTAVAVLTLALGIGVTTAIYSLVRGVLVGPLPYGEPERIAMVFEKRPRENSLKTPAAPADYLDWRQRNTVFAAMAAYDEASADLVGRGEPLKLDAGSVTADFFRVLGVRPLLGRLFEPGDDVEGRDGVVVLGYGAWQRCFAGDSSVVGRRVNLGGRQREVVGVLPETFRFPGMAEIWLPMVFSPEVQRWRSLHYLRVYARLRPETSLPEARSAMESLGDALALEHPDTNAHHGVHVVALRDQLVGDVRPMLLALMFAVVLVVLIACANVANLLLSRAALRRRELAIRGALGASGGRLVLLVLAESAVLSLTAGACGAFLAVWLTDILGLLLRSHVSSVGLADIAVNVPVLLFALGLSLATSLLAGLPAAWQATRVDLNESLKEGGRTSAGVSRPHLRRGLVLAEVALSVILLAGAGLLLRTVARLHDVSPGFAPRNVLTVPLDLPETRYGKPERIASFYRGLLEATGQLPGVTAAGAVSQLPLGGSDARTGVEIEGREAREGEPTRMHRRTASPGYFEALGIPLRAGRGFEERDAQDAPPVLLVNETAARLYWPGRSPVGRRVRLAGTEAWREVVGVVGDVKHWGLDQAVRPEMYFPPAQEPMAQVTLVVRAAGDPMSLVPALRGALRRLDAELPLGTPVLMERVIERSVSPRWFFLTLMAAFAGLALVLAALGIYSVTSYGVAQRTHEIGVRMSLGARMADVRKLVLGETLRLSAGGIALGLLGAVMLGRFIEKQLFGVPPADPLTLAAVAGVLLGVSLLAADVPARRAARVDPTLALRGE